MSTDNVVELPDFQWENHGSFLLLEPRTERAREHWAQFGDPNAMWFGQKIFVEYRHAPLLYDQLNEAGMVQR